MSNGDLVAIHEVGGDVGAGRDALVIELMRDWENLTELHARAGGFVPAAAERVGIALGAYHARSDRILHEAIDLSAFPRELPIRIIDWELADLGDVCWDVASIWAAYLAQAVGTPSSDPLAAARPALGAFWRAYAHARAWDVAAAQGYLARSVRFCGARLVALAYEYLHHAPQATRAAHTLLQTSAQLFHHPRAAIQAMVGG